MFSIFKQKTKLILALNIIIVLSLAIPFSLAAEETDSLHWAQAELWELEAQGIIKTNLNPSRYITRAEFTTMLVKSLGLDAQAKALETVPLPFKDIEDNHSQRGYIALALEKALIAGYSADTFHPDEELRRDQMIVLLLRLMQLGELKEEAQYLAFEDQEDIPDYARRAISTGVKLGLVAGYTDQSFRPAQKITLAESAAFINRWKELMGDRYDYSGIFQKAGEKSLEIAVDGNTLVFPFLNTGSILIEGKPASLKTLVPGQQINIKLNGRGEIILAHQKQLNFREIEYSMAARALPRANPKKALPQVAGLFNPRLPLDTDNMQKSLDMGKEAINLPSLISATDSQGRGQIIAIIDTGVDPSHPDLAITSDGLPKLLEWVDFTSEGLVDIFPASEIKDKILIKDSQEYKLGDIPSRSGQYRIGHLDLNAIAPLELLAKDKPRQVAVLLTDSLIAGVYDTVYLDTNNDYSFAEEKALKLFRTGQSYVSLSYQESSLALAVVDIHPQGNYIQLANDISGHGTHVAGIIGANGKLRGVAPGAQIMVLKAVERDGFADPQNIMEAMRYAALHGADIINISLGQYQDSLPGESQIAQLTNELIEKYRIMVVSAAGNIGPGLSSTASPADADGTLSIGAFVSTQMWRTDFAYRVPKDSLYYFSSIGPRKDGAWYPSLIAPGSAVSTVPLWMGEEYLLTEGTSMAAPFVSGVIAHLLENAANQGLQVTPAILKRALEESARDLAHLEIAEQGHGVLDAYQAWLKLRELKEERQITVEVYNPEYSKSSGIFAREYIPAGFNLKLINKDNKDYHLEWTASQDWIKIDHQTTNLLAQNSRDISLFFDLPDKAGLYSGVLKGNDPKYPGLEVEIPINIIIGESIDQVASKKAVYLDRLKPAELARYFVTLPSGLTGFKANLAIFPDTDGIYQGRARIHLVNPFGLEIKQSDYTGENPGPISKKGQVELLEFFPEEGTWEVVVYSSAALSEFNLTESKYELTLETGEILDFSERLESDLDLTLSPITQKAWQKPAGPVIVHLWDNKEGKPFHGALEINTRLYQIQNGRLEYSLELLKENKSLQLVELK